MVGFVVRIFLVGLHSFMLRVRIGIFKGRRINL